MSNLPLIGENYQHYKGGVYRVLNLAKLEADQTDVVIYQSQRGQVWVRPVDEFIGIVTVDGNNIPRFRLLR